MLYKYLLSWFELNINKAISTMSATQEVLYKWQLLHYYLKGSFLTILNTSMAILVGINRTEHIK
jgi:hypothetical protein